ncbi:MAG: thermonuclease family protein [Chloracidobacterium sp.]|nr:thermonuclease family protein [Chloracidobacterium sp.]
MLKIFALSIFTLVSIGLFADTVSAQFPIGGQVVDVIDGKTLLVAVPGGKVKVELQYIEVPEPAQDLHDTVKAHLRTLLVGKSVEYRPKTIFTDRAIGQVTIRNLDMSQQMLRDGAAWHMPKESSGQTKAEFDIYASLETAAKNDKLGVWSVPGLTPAWEFRAERKKIQEQLQYDYAKSPSTTIMASRKLPLRPRGNPSLGNVGALANGYDPQTGRGYIGTSFLKVRELDQSIEADQQTSVDISYFYRQGEGNKRTGTYVFSIVSTSKKWRFLTNNNLILTGSGKDVVIGKAKRTSTSDGDDMREKLVYEISRAALERIVNDDEIKLKVGAYLVEPAPGLKYVLYNLLQVSQ